MLSRFAIACFALCLCAGQNHAAAGPLVCPTGAAAQSIPTEQLKPLFAEGSIVERTAGLNRIVTALRDRGMNAGAIVDNLISAYCPVVAANAALNDRQKTMTVRQFAAQVARAVYTPDSADEIILDVPLPPAIANALNGKAQAERISPQEWAARAIANDLKPAR